MDLSRAVSVAGDPEHHAALWQAGRHGRACVKALSARQGNAG